MDLQDTVMKSFEGILSFMDLLDLDEEMIDSRLKSLMIRKTYTNEHLVSAIHLLQYKHLINTQENNECENDTEFEFVVKLIEHINSENIDNVCKIVHIVLCLNIKSLVSKSEHLIQQILSNTYLTKENATSISVVEEETLKQTLLSFKVCDSILDAVSKTGQKISLLFLEVPLENVLSSSWELLKVHFLTSTAPKLFENIVGYDILHRIWMSIRKSCTGNEKERALKTLSCLSDYYVPVPDDNGLLKFESEVIFQNEFWNLLLFGLESDDTAIRKISIYLSKRAIDCVRALKKDIDITAQTEQLFFWNTSDEKSLKQLWDNYFILIDSLQEKQSNIVLPSLNLFDEIKDICKCWLHPAFKIGLKHDNTQVKLKCIDYRFKVPLRNAYEAKILLEALNDINLYENAKDEINIALYSFIEDGNNFLIVFEVIPKIKWSPVPFYYVSKALSELKLKNVDEIISNEKICNVINDLLRIPCNSIPIRNAIYHYIAQFVDNSIELHWKDLINIHITLIASSVAFKESIKILKITPDQVPLTKSINNLKIKPEEQDEFLKIISKSYLNIDFFISYLYSNNEMVEPFLGIINEKIMRLSNFVSRKYSNQSEGLNDLIYLLYLADLLQRYNDKFKMQFHHVILEVILNNWKTLLQYIQCLLSSDFVVNIEDVKVFFTQLDFVKILKNQEDIKEIILILLNTCLNILLFNNSDINEKLLSICVVKYTFKNYAPETINEERFMKMINRIELNEDTTESSGRVKNLFYEKSCESIYCLLKFKDNKATEYLQDIINYIDKTIERGGYGCLKWILKIVNRIIPKILECNDIEFDIIQFLNRAWKEIEELKSNNQYTPCIEEFVELITQRCLLEKAMYNNVIILYCNKIIEYAPQKDTALYHLITKLNDISVTPDYGQMIYVLCEILLYVSLPRKDQRILENLTVTLTDYIPIHMMQNTYFNSEIQYLAASALSNINNKEIYETISLFITKRVDEMFKNKRRYHDNSHSHRTLLRSLQHLLMMCLMNPESLMGEKIVVWSEDLLAKLPHQPSVRTSLEWLIALHYYVKNTNLTELVSRFKSKNIPITSQLTILYWILKHRVLYKTCEAEEFCLFMDFFLSHTMGQIFNIRLHAQYLASKLQELRKHEKYCYIIEVIEKTFNESSNDKSFMKIKNDKFYNDFDIVANLTPEFVYFFLPRYFNMGANENVDLCVVISTINDIHMNIDKKHSDRELKKEWMNISVMDDKLYHEINEMNELQNTMFSEEYNDTVGTIQKKYIPWKNMTDIKVYDKSCKKESPSELIVVASLIDKPPNLGGVMRTGEVFGVRRCVLASGGLARQPQLQALSVSAERWVNIEEVRPGAPLKSYLMRLKGEGFSVVAAEQTSNSCQLHKFKFPKKTVLLLGHEKEGVPCDLLPLMDHCVEIPQLGVIRSLNVHVTAAIFMWEYTRQHVL